MMVGANNSEDGYFFTLTGVLVYMKVSDKMKFEFRTEPPSSVDAKGDHSNYLFLTGDFVL